MLCDAHNKLVWPQNVVTVVVCCWLYTFPSNRCLLDVEVYNYTYILIVMSFQKASLMSKYSGFHSQEILIFLEMCINIVLHCNDMCDMLIFYRDQDWIMDTYYKQIKYEKISHKKYEYFFYLPKKRGRSIVNKMDSLNWHIRKLQRFPRYYIQFELHLK